MEQKKIIHEKLLAALRVLGHENFVTLGIEMKSSDRYRATSIICHLTLRIPLYRNFAPGFIGICYAAMHESVDRYSEIVRERSSDLRGVSRGEVVAVLVTKESIHGVDCMAEYCERLMDGNHPECRREIRKLVEALAGRKNYTARRSLLAALAHDVDLYFGVAQQRRPRTNDAALACVVRLSDPSADVLTLIYRMEGEERALIARRKSEVNRIEKLKAKRESKLAAYA